MDLRGILRALWRQWPVTLLLVIATAAVAVSSMGRVQTNYQSQASLLFVASPRTVDAQGDPITVNPLSVSGNAERVASSAILALSRSPGFVDTLREAGAPGEVKFRRSADAVLTVKAKAATPDGAVGTLDAAITHVREQLDAQQAAAGAPLGSFMQIETLAHSDHAQPLEGNPFRAVGAIVLVGVLVMVAVTVALDAIAPHGFRRMGARIRRTFRAGVGRLTVPQHADTGASKGPLEPPPAPAPAPPSTPVGANGNREARRRAAREGRGSGPPPRTPRGGDRSQTPSRPS